MSDPVLPPDADPRDPHLLAALRHAPDRDLVPPAQLTASILEQAHRAVAPAPLRPARQTGRWRERWAWLWQPAPMAAFGTVVMATLIGVLWGGRDLPDATPDLHPGRVATAPTVQAPATPPADNAAPAVAAPATDAVAAAEKSSGRVEADAARDRRAAKEVPRAASRSAPAAPAARDTGATGKFAEAPPDRLTLVLPKAAPAEAEARRDALAKSMADAAPSQATGSAMSRARSEQATLGAAAPAPAAPPAQASAEPDLALPSDAARVRWRVAAGRVLPHEAAQADWWAAMLRGTQGRWRRVAAADTGAAVALLVDGAPWGSLGFEPEGIFWRDAKGLVWRAPASAGQLRDWQEALARW